MASTRLQNIANKPQTTTSVPVKKGVTTRNKSAQISNNLAKQPITLAKNLRGKRKAEVSPLKEKSTKRSALGNITNALIKNQVQTADPKKLTKKITCKTVTKPNAQIENNNKPTNAEKTLKKLEIVPTKIKQIRIKQIKEDEEKKSLVRRSAEFEKSDESSLYVSALEEVHDENAKNLQFKENDPVGNESKFKSTPEKTTATAEEPKKIKRVLPVKQLPNGVTWNFDAENWHDSYQVSPYAEEIFEYLKQRESLFPIGDYINKQICLSKWMRSLLVDWMVEVQESFELNHETLYLAVKLVDLYLTKVTVGKETLQLLGAASLFIASKYDERIPPMIEDFLYICDGAYTQRELIKMEINVLKMMDFDLGVPLSYRFLRRYARCAKVSMPTLTLARYILEYSLMDYATIRFNDSKMAAAALFLALYMKDISGWTPTLEFYTGYKISDIKMIVLVLNEGLHRKQKEQLSTVRNKYSHKLFFEVAKVPLKEIKDL